MTRDYCAIARKYCDDVLSGKVLACDHVQRACQRQVDDLAKDWSYQFDEDRASHVCRFLELLPHVKGKWAGELIKLEPWQVFILTTVFGWVDSSGNRRFRVAYIEVPRKNAKSTLSSGVALYCLAVDGEAGAQVVSAATTRDQARIVFDDAKQMVRRTPALRNRLGLRVFEHAIVRESDASSFKALSRDQGGNLDGLNIHCAVIDELHAHKTRDIFDVIETATGSRTQPLIWCITTAGFNRTGICYEQRAYVRKILDGFEDDTYFGVIYTLDDGDDWVEFDSRVKANPNWGVSVQPDDIERKVRKACEMASAVNNVLTKHFNLWVNAETAWMDMRAWDACADHTLRLEQFAGKKCVIALDLASKIDIAAKLYLFREDGIYYPFLKSYLPEETIYNSTNSQYQGWARQGLITETEGAVIDFEVIEEELIADKSAYQVEAVPYDPFQATELATRMMKEGLPMIEYGATVRNFSEPMKQLEALVLDGKLKHDGNPILTWMISNTTCRCDAKDNVYPRKAFPENKIDGVVALIMGIGFHVKREQEEDNPYETRGIQYA